MIQTHFSSDGHLIWWDAAKAPRSGVRSAFQKAGGLEGFVPLFDPIACLKGVCNGIVKKANLTVRGQPIEPRQLARDVYGVTAVREIKGKTRNQFVHLFSVGCTGSDLNNFSVQLWDVDRTEAAMIAANLADYDKFARDLWNEDKDFIPAKQLTESMRRLVFHCNGTMLKGSGGLYFIPDEKIGIFESVAKDIEATGSEAQFTSGKFDTTLNPRLFQRLLDGLNDEIVLATSQMQDEVAELASNSRKMRRNGIERRLNDLQQWRDKIEYYERLMNTSMPHLRQAVDAAKYAIGVHGLESLGAKG